MFVRNTIGLWLFLILLTTPFPFDWIPRFGEGISWLLAPVTSGILDTVGIEHTASVASDSIHQYVKTIFLLIPAILLTYLSAKTINLSGKEKDKILVTSLAFLCGLFLVKYGAIKIFQHQFYSIEPNIAYTPVGMLSKDILFWTSIGTSCTYNMIFGLVEVLIGLFLLFEKTRFTGSLLAVGAFFHILALNISFDITVKLFSFTLLASSLYLVLHWKSRMKAIFIPNTVILKETEFYLITNAKLRKSISLGVALLIIFESFSPFLDNKNSEIDHLIEGSYSVNTPHDISFFNGIKRVHFNSKGYLIIESESQVFKDYEYLIANDANEILIKKLGLTFQLQHEEDGVISITSSNNKTLTLTPENWKDLPIHKDQFHWTYEGVISD